MLPGAIPRETDAICRQLLFVISDLTCRRTPAYACNSFVTRQVGYLDERYFPNVLLTTHESKQVRFYDDLIKDKAVVIKLMFASCNHTCPLITANLTRVQELLSERVGRDCSFTRPPLIRSTIRRRFLIFTQKSYDIGPVGRCQAWADY